MILYNSLGFLKFTDVSLIQKVEIKLLKLVYFSINFAIWKNAYIS